MAKSSSQSGEPSIRQLQTVVDILETPALARLYAYIRQEGPVTVSEIIAAVEIPQGTAYDYIERLESAGLLTQTRQKRPAEYDTESLSLTLSTDGESRTITPTLIAAVARRETDEDLDVFVDRHGLDGLAAAVEYATEYVEGTVNHRIAARELDVSPLEAEIVLQALQPIVTEDADQTA